MSLSAAINAFLRLGDKQPFLAVILGALLSLGAVASACVYFGTSTPQSGTVAEIIFAMFAIAVLAVLHLALSFVERAITLLPKNAA